MSVKQNWKKQYSLYHLREKEQLFYNKYSCSCWFYVECSIQVLIMKTTFDNDRKMFNSYKYVCLYFNFVIG